MALAVASLLVVTAGLAALIGGIWLTVATFPSWWTFAGVALLGLAVVMRPRLGRVPRRGQSISATQAPTLFRLLGDVAEEVGTVVPDRVVLDASYNAAFGRAGLRRRRVLVLGVPLWVSLPPQQRVVVLAHELGHDINGDPLRSALIGPAVTAVASLARVSRADVGLGTVLSPDRTDAGPTRIGSEVLLWLVSRVFLVVHLGIAALATRDHQRAEYLADGIAARVAGSTATVESLDRTCFAAAINALIGYGAETSRPTEWRGKVQTLLERHRDGIGRQRQLTTRHTSLWSTHPPAGMRARAIEAAPQRPPTVTLTEPESERIDAELAGWYNAAHRLILGTREFRGRG